MLKRIHGWEEQLELDQKSKSSIDVFPYPHTLSHTHTLLVLWHDKQFNGTNEFDFSNRTGLSSEERINKLENKINIDNSASRPGRSVSGIWRLPRLPRHTDKCSYTTRVCVFVCVLLVSVGTAGVRTSGEPTLKNIFTCLHFGTVLLTRRISHSSPIVPPSLALRCPSLQKQQIPLRQPI